MVILRRVNEANKTMFEKGYDELVSVISDVAKKRGLKVSKKNGTGFMISGKWNCSVHVSLSLKEAMEGVYTLSIDESAGRKWRLSDNEIINPKTGTLKKFDKNAQIQNLLDTADSLIKKQVQAEQERRDSEKQAKKDAKKAEKDAEATKSEKAEGVRRLSRIRFI